MTDKLIIERPPSIKAVFKPREDQEFSSLLERCIGKPYTFYECRSVREDKMFMSDDKNFPASSAICEHDLDFTNDYENKIKQT